MNNRILITISFLLFFGLNRAQTSLLTVSTETANPTHGLYALQYKNGSLTAKDSSRLIPFTKYHVNHPNQPWLYAVGMNRIYALKKDSAQAQLATINYRASQGSNPCYVSMDQTGKIALLANFSGGTIASFPIGDQGNLGQPSSVVNLNTAGLGGTSRPHMILSSPDNSHVLVPDLAKDIVYYLRLTDSGELIRVPEKDISTEYGSGPRHLVFHPSLSVFYLLNEYHSTLTLYKSTPGRGPYTKIFNYPMLPFDFTGESRAADVHITNNGEFLYASNRGHNSIVAFKIHKNGRLRLIEHYGSGGDAPRSFDIAPDDSAIYVGNQYSNNVVHFLIDPKTGALTRSGRSVSVPAPRCVTIQ